MLIFMENNKQSVSKFRETSTKRRIFLILFLVVLVGSLFKAFLGLKSKFFSEKAVEISINQELVETQKKEEKKEKFNTYVIFEGDIPAEVFGREGKFDANDMEKILFSSKDIYDFTNIKIGQTLRFYFDEDKEEKAKRIEYDQNTEDYIIVERNGNEFSTRKEKIAYEVSQEIARGKIDNFFYADALEAGVQEATVLEVGDIFSFDIDFTTEIQKDDEFIIVYEKRNLNGEKAPDGKILAAKFVNVGQSFHAYFFDNDGNGGYYDGEGRVLERQFLKAPLSYRHISSGFTGARMHPITRKVSAHYQIDYAAPSGTPVVASARGTLVSAGFEGGWGNIVRLRHDNGYTTHYGHLSAFAKNIRSEGKISQGQVIGYVGSTGWSTGPHLDYGIKLNGTPVNPLKLNLPKGQPLNEEKMKIFTETKNKYNDFLK